MQEINDSATGAIGTASFCTLVEIFIMADTVYLIYSGCQELTLGHEFQTLYFYK